MPNDIVAKPPETLREREMNGNDSGRPGDRRQRRRHPGDFRGRGRGRLIGKSVSGPGWFWLVVDGEVGAMEVLTIGLAAGEEALPVFSFEDEAAMFLGLGGFDGDWRVRVTTAGELISVLFGPCAGVRRVVLDPLPAPYAALNGLVSVERKAFMEFIEASPRPGMESDRKPIRRFGAGVEAATRAGR